MMLFTGLKTGQSVSGVVYHYQVDDTNGGILPDAITMETLTDKALYVSDSETDWLPDHLSITVRKHRLYVDINNPKVYRDSPIRIDEDYDLLKYLAIKDGHDAIVFLPEDDELRECLLLYPKTSVRDIASSLITIGGNKDPVLQSIYDDLTM